MKPGPRPDLSADSRDGKRVSRMRISRAWPIPVLILVFLGINIVLGRLEPRATWLEVDGPRAAIVGEPLELRITLEALPEAVRLGCNLNWSRKDRKWAGTLASGSPYPWVRDAGTTAFHIPVKAQKGMAFVSAIIFLTPTGRWRDSFRVAYTELIPVRSAQVKGAEAPLRRLKVYPSVSPAALGTAQVTDQESGVGSFCRIRGFSAGRAILAAVLAAAAVICAVNASRSRAAGGDRRPKRKKTAWLVLSAFSAAAALTEITGIQANIIGWGRQVAEGLGLYYLRRSFQRPLAAGVIVAGVLLIVLLLKRWTKARIDAALWVAVLGLGGYLLATLLAMLSYHPLDALPGLSFLGVSITNLAKAGGATLALGGAAAALIREKASPGA